MASPFENVEEDAANLVTSAKALTAQTLVPRYTWATARIDQILEGDTPTACVFDPSLFLSDEADADCYGPTVPYVGHPDAGLEDPDDSLPLGDVGIWVADDPGTGHACAAAELNARMRGVSNQSVVALMGLASLKCLITVNAYAMPSGSTLDLTDEMNALGIAETVFTSATLGEATNADGDAQYSYHMAFTYSPSGVDHAIEVDMDHIPGSTDETYRGRFSYLVDDSLSTANCPSGELTANGSVLYERSGVNEISLEARHAAFCGYGSDGRVDGLVNPGDKYRTDNPTGWSDRFSILTAEFDPGTLAGNYAYSWQAGPGDDNARVFNVAIDSGAGVAASDPGSPELVNAGVMFYGYGEEIESSDGAISGFICNWAGPNADHTLLNFAQYQSVAFDEDTELIEALISNITYAPVNGCDYDGTGTFSYDSDIDGAVDTDPALPISNNLLGLTDGDGDGVFDEISASGFSLPLSPANF